MFGDPMFNSLGWPEVPLKDVCLVGGEYGAGVPSREFDVGLPRYIRITDVTDEGDLTSLPVSPGREAGEWEKYRLARGDVLFARSGATVGKTYLHQSDADAVFAGYLIRFRPDPEKLLPEVLFQFTRTGAYRRWVENNQRTVAQPNINAKQYGEDLRVPVPPLDLQEDFVERLKEVEGVRLVGDASRPLVKELLASIQRRAFSGAL
jgi:type I restriction enzyme, S subunit